jgi:hypothetical protein
VGTNPTVPNLLSCLGFWREPTLLGTDCFELGYVYSVLLYSFMPEALHVGIYPEARILRLRYGVVLLSYLCCGDRDWGHYPCADGLVFTAILFPSA